MSPKMLIWGEGGFSFILSSWCLATSCRSCPGAACQKCDCTHLHQLINHQPVTQVFSVSCPRTLSVHAGASIKTPNLWSWDISLNYLCCCHPRWRQWFSILSFFSYSLFPLACFLPHWFGQPPSVSKSLPLEDAAHGAVVFDVVQWYQNTGSLHLT